MITADILHEVIWLVMEIEAEATERKINTVAHLPELRQYEQGRADTARAILALWSGCVEIKQGDDTERE